MIGKDKATSFVQSVTLGKLCKKKQTRNQLILYVIGMIPIASSFKCNGVFSFSLKQICQNTFTIRYFAPNNFIKLIKGEISTNVSTIQIIYPKCSHIISFELFKHLLIRTHTCTHISATSIRQCEAHLRQVSDVKRIFLSSIQQFWQSPFSSQKKRKNMILLF